MTRRTSGPITYLPNHGDTRYSVRHYDLDLDYKVATNHLSATARLTAIARQPLSEVVLDLAGLRASKVSIDSRPARTTHRGNRLTARPAKPIPAGTEFTVRVVYAGKPQPVRGLEGRVGWEELTDGVLVGSQPDGAPSWFPCNDRLDDKATYRVSTTVPQGYRVAGNGVLTATSTRSGRTTYVFEQRQPMSTYLACVQIGRYLVSDVRAEGLQVPVQVWHPSRIDLQRSAFERQAQMMLALSELFGPYPFDAYRVVITEDELEIPLEAQSLSSFGINHVETRWENERLVAHELAHQWFGNSLTAASWQHIWLHEGFACYAEWLWSECSGGRSADEHARHHHARLAKLPKDLVLSNPGPQLMFDDRVYKRGALTLHALRKSLGDNVFFTMLRAWTTANAHGLVSTDTFCQHAANHSASPDQVRQLLTAWLDRTALPPLA